MHKTMVMEEGWLVKFCSNYWAKANAVVHKASSEDVAVEEVA